MKIGMLLLLTLTAAGCDSDPANVVQSSTHHISKNAIVGEAGRYSEEEARSICRMRGGADFMVPCEVIEAEAVRVVDVDKLKQFSPAAEEERSSL